MSEVDVGRLSRRMWVLFETYHDVTYFTPESRAAADALGCRGGWMGYFGMRAAPLGAVSAETAASAFYNFHVSLVDRALPDAWSIAEPSRFLRARLSGVDACLRRMLGDDVLGGRELVEAARLAVASAALAPTAGRPLAAANAVLPVPAAPHLALWHATTVLRESRGDGHIATLIAAGLDPCETLVLFAADHGLSPAFLRGARGWSEETWRQATQRLIERGLLGDAEVLSPLGAELREWVEQRTDALSAAPWLSLGRESTDRFAALFQPIARSIAEQNDAMRQNPMALDFHAELSR